MLLSRAHSARPAAHRRNLMLFVQIAGLLATSWIVWSVSLLPRLGREPLTGVIVQALSYTLLVCLSSAVITFSLYLLVARSFQEDAIRMALRTSASAVWFAAATILLADLSTATIPAALVLVVSTTRLLYSQFRLTHPDDSRATVAPLGHPIFDPLPPLRIRAVVPGLAASFAIQGGIVILPIGYPLLASALFCLAVAMITLGTHLAGLCHDVTSVSLPRSTLGFVLTLILAAGLTVGGLSGSLGGEAHWHSRLQPRPGPFESARALLHKFFEGDGENQIKQPVTNLYLPPSGSVEITDNSFPGVVLLPEAKPDQPVLIAPSASALRASPDAAPNKPVSIPFTGQYWMYRPPSDRPPRTSHVQQGTPLALSFRTTDHAPMVMEAYQNLDRAIDTKCCRAIQIEISNLDRYPSTVALELVLIDMEAPTQQMVSLGTALVASRPRGNAMPASEILEFAMKSSAQLRQFDEFKVIFHRDPMRHERSARISVDAFVLLPRRK